MCKSELAYMESEAILEVHLRDPQTIEDLLTILDRSGETVLPSYRARITLPVDSQGKVKRPPCRGKPGM
jgi:TusA-related sulfurtransferase